VCGGPKLFGNSTTVSVPIPQFRSSCRLRAVGSGDPFQQVIFCCRKLRDWCVAGHVRGGIVGSWDRDFLPSFRQHKIAACATPVPAIPE